MILELTCVITWLSMYGASIMFVYIFWQIDAYSIFPVVMENLTPTTTSKRVSK